VNARKVEVESQFDSEKRKKEEGRRKGEDERGVRTGNSWHSGASFYMSDLFPMTMVIGNESLRLVSLGRVGPLQLDKRSVSW
jgi:hypothetical protein